MQWDNRTSAALTALLVGICLCFKSDKESQPYVFPDLEFFPKMPEPEHIITQEGVELGRYLFYDSILSLDFSFSCASCHKQKAAFSDAPNKLSKGINGDRLSRNTMPLFNLAWYDSFFWDGRAVSIEEQVFHPVRAHDEMNLAWTVAEMRLRKSKIYRSRFKAAFGNLQIDSLLITNAIGQFLRTLISNNSKYDKVLREEEYFTADEFEGFVLINDQKKGDCLHCHTTDADALGTTGGFSNNGLSQVYSQVEYKDKGKGGVSGILDEIGLFRIPSLRNIAVTAPYMHDGRFQTLEEVLDFYSGGVSLSYNIDAKMQYAHMGGVNLTEEEKSKIITFLKTLTDSSFLKNSDFANPFITE